MKKIFSFFFIALLLSPIMTSAQSTTLQRQGIFDCSQNGAYAMSVGALGATGGVYVPVADATVELNTGVLVYKECVLREMVDRMREAAMAGLTQTATKSVLTGRTTDTGETVPQYVVQERKESLAVSDKSILATLKDGTLNGLNPALKTSVTRALARKYEVETRDTESTLACPLKGDLAAFQKGTAPFNFPDFLAGTDPHCDPVFAEFFAEDLSNARIAQDLGYQRDEWNWGRGYYAKVDSNGNVVTPAVNVQESFQTILDSPVHQLESANDIGQMINAYYAGMTTYMLSDTQGLAGMTQSFGGQASYLDQVVTNANQGLQNALQNIALINLQSAWDTEVRYFQTVNAIGAVYTQAIRGLRSVEGQCWDTIIYKNDGHPERHVCAGPLAANNTCTASGTCTPDPSDPTAPPVCTAGVAIKVATSTAFSQSVIDASITKDATDAVANINKSQTALTLIKGLIDSVTGASASAQQIAIVELNNLVAQKKLHVPPDVDGPNGVVKQLDAAQATMLSPDTGLVASTVKLWADSATLLPGWCNVNNPTVIDAWKRCWDKNHPNAAACPRP